MAKYIFLQSRQSEILSKYGMNRDCIVPLLSSKARLWPWSLLAALHVDTVIKYEAQKNVQRVLILLNLYCRQKKVEKTSTDFLV